MSPSPHTVGIIGLGSMGKPMAGHIIRAGHDVVVLHRSLHKASGARAVDTPRHMARQCDVVILLVPGAPEIDGVLDELVEGARERDADHDRLVLAISSTVSPVDITRWHRDTSGVEFVDAPISGGEAGAIRGDLSVMVGGDDATTGLVSDVLSSCGRPVHLGPLGSGQVAKACNQLICAAEIVALSEASVVAERAGLDLATLLDLLQGGYAGSVIMNDKTPKLVAHDYSVSAQAAFVHKDVSAYLDAARATGTKSVLGGPIASAARQLIDAGLGEQDSAVFQKWIAERAEPNQ
ncbi:2-hydroxy-3-oxopropionate reductase [Kocuria marina]|uniref:2-hydroxy-3-oxopropionate reductase n=1 Tax=Kocuria marina TaxID=223184 RepID=A0A0B0D9T3_9MICC|nr:NAD(P)-dependent oxidoreductase [Kocuria marina]KHE73515.1 2-hydroxy-3-oxopropionate reductase [Kocuria marina]